MVGSESLALRMIEGNALACLLDLGRPEEAATRCNASRWARSVTEAFAAPWCPYSSHPCWLRLCEVATRLFVWLLVTQRKKSRRRRRAEATKARREPREGKRTRRERNAQSETHDEQERKKYCKNKTTKEERRK